MLHPDALVIPDARVGKLLPLNDEELVVVYGASDDGDTRSRRLLDVFNAWPPGLSEPLMHGERVLDTAVPAHARRDGAFVAHASDEWFVGSAYDESVLVRPPSGEPSAYPILEPQPEGGVFWSYAGTLDFYANLDAAEPSATFTLPTPVSRRAHGVGFDGATLIVQDTKLYTWDGSLTAIDGTQETAVYEQIVYRPGGFYLRDFLTVYPYDERDGWLPSLKLDGSDGPETGQHAGASWRGGVAYSAIFASNDVWIGVTDAKLMTSTIREDLGACLNGISIVASPDGDHLYVAFLHCPSQTAEGVFVVRRFDCVPPEG